MALHKKELKYLLRRYREGRIEESEWERLKEWGKCEGVEEGLWAVWDDDFVEEEVPDTHADPEQIYAAIQHRLALEPVRSHSTFRRNKLLRRMAVAASIALVLGVGMGIYWLQRSGLEREDMASTSKILPGKEKARIVLETGEVIDLEEIGRDTVLAFNDFSIAIDKEGMVSYLHAPQITSKKPIYNTIETPRGGEHQLQLPDGSKVWLNAESRLRYPVAFTDAAREVKLEGEGYFEVVKAVRKGKRQPFIVHTGAQQLEVLGTNFNINSHGTGITTTLVEGAVALRYLGASAETLLRPEQQAVYEEDKGQYTVKHVDTFYITAWKNGNFAFDNASVEDVMETIARWYNVEVEFSENLSHKRFSGTISRLEDFETLLSIIEKTGSVRFEINGRRVRVMT